MLYKLVCFRPTSTFLAGIISPLLEIVLLLSKVLGVNNEDSEPPEEDEGEVLKSPPTELLFKEWHPLSNAGFVFPNLHKDIGLLLLKLCAGELSLKKY